MVPVSIIYDQLHEVGEFVAESTGAAKETESLAWVDEVAQVPRRRRHLGRIYVRFGEPISLRDAVGAPTRRPRRTISPAKLGFDVSPRINAGAPITASALICMVLLASAGRAFTARELHRSLAPVLDQVRARGLPLAESARARHGGGRAARRGVARRQPTRSRCTTRGSARLSRPTGHHLAAAFYRNTIVHHFVGGSIGELAMIHAAELDVPAANVSTRSGRRRSHLRHLLEFDFFFEQRERVPREVAEELRGRLPGWEDQLLAGVEPTVLLDKMQPLNAFAVLRPFVEAYLVVARALLEHRRCRVDRKAFVKCLALGEQWVHQDASAAPRRCRSTCSSQRSSSPSIVALSAPARRHGAARAVRRRARRCRAADRRRRGAHLRRGRRLAHRSPVVSRHQFVSVFTNC